MPGAGVSTGEDEIRGYKTKGYMPVVQQLSDISVIQPDITN